MINSNMGCIETGIRVDVYPGFHRLIVIWDVLKQRNITKKIKKKSRLIVIWDVLKLKNAEKELGKRSRINSNMGCIETLHTDSTVF